MKEPFIIKEMPPFRANPFGDGQKDILDGKRLNFLHGLWGSQTWALQYRDRQVEENIRMLAGQQWMIFSDLLQKWVDVARFLTQDERRWRQRPVINRLLYWYMLTHARMTENPPVVTFQPATGDRSDAQLAEVMDTVFKTLWNEIGMVENVDLLMSNLIPGGASYLRSTVDPDAGPLREYRGELEHEGQTYQDVPYNDKGEPQVEFDGGMVKYGEPYRYNEGKILVSVHNPLEVRSEWNNKPHHQKRWHMLRTYLTVEQVLDRWGIEVEPDTSGEEADGAGELQRIMFGAGYFGAAGNKPGVGGYDHGYSRELVRVDEFWHMPSRILPGMEETPDSPGGRLMVASKEHILFDGPRPARFKGASPIHRFDFVNLPGRPHGTSPQEMLNPIQRTYNRGVAQILEHRNLVTNPAMVIDEQSGLEEEQITNKPGLILKVNRRPGIPAIEYAEPPQLSTDVWHIQEMLQEEMDFLGNLEGSEGTPPTRDASGELVKELRFNTDRFLGPTLRRAAITMGRVVEDWMQLLPVIWDEEKVLQYAGEDSITRTVTVLPQMFQEGKVNVAVDVESMLPEGRGERQNRIYRMYADGLLGMPGTPEARKAYFDLSRFPHMARATRPGGVHRSTAEQENGKMVTGTPSDQIPILEWYDNMVHMWIHEEFMSSPEYLRLPPEVQTEFHRHWIKHKLVEQAEIQQQMMMAAAMNPEEGGEGGPPSENGGGPQGPTPEGSSSPIGPGSRPIPQGPPSGPHLPRFAQQ
jgi:hypothetical protein